MALVKCAECEHLVSTMARACPQCGYEPKGNCKWCIYFVKENSFNKGRCILTKDDYVREDKGVCPGVVKKSWLIY